MISRTEFGRAIESAGPGRTASTLRGGIAKDVLDADKQLRQRVLPVGTPMASVVGALGPPDQQLERNIDYDLGTRPGYVYRFTFDSAGKLFSSGYVRRQKRVAPAPFPNSEHDFDLFVATLAKSGATSDELRSWYEAPVEESGWWPIEAWTYRGGLTVEFRHGVVESDG